MSAFDVIWVVIVTVVLATIVLQRWQKAKLPQVPAGFPGGSQGAVKSHVTGPSPRTGSDAIGLYRKMGYDGFADQLEKEALPCVALVPMKSESELDPGRSHIGGLPDLPDPELWPKRNGKSLSFIAQVDLDEVPNEADIGVLPRKGRLYFFYYDADALPSGFDPKHEGSWRVIYMEQVPDGSSPVEFPRDLPEHSRYEQVPVRLESQISIPDPCEIFSEHNLTDEQEDEIIYVYGQLVEDSVPRHQLLGHPATIQSDMRLECQLVSHGIYLGGLSAYRSRRAKELEPGAVEWRLLLQVDSDEDAQMMWGDCGRLYFWIREQDLKERRFDKVWMILQSY